MNYTTEKITNKHTWEDLVSAHPEANFLQSWNWGEFHISLGKDVYRVAVNDTIQTVGLYTAVIERAKRGNYVTVAGGPLLNWDNTLLVEFVLTSLSKLARQTGCQFVRFRPQVVESLSIRTQLKKNGVKEAPMHLTADLTLQIDLKLSQEELLSQMKKNTRSTIRKAEKLGIETHFSQNPGEINRFYKLQCQLAKRQGFVPFSKKFLTQQFEAFAQDNQVVLASSYYQDKLLAQAFVIFYNQEAVYHYGVSTEDNSNQLPGSYACQWAVMLEAQKRGCLRYNMWGIAPENEKNHRFAGVSLFKRGFGGDEVPYLPAHDIPTSLLYVITRGFERMRAWHRGLR